MNDKRTIRAMQLLRDRGWEPDEIIQKWKLEEGKAAELRIEFNNLDVTQERK